MGKDMLFKHHPQKPYEFIFFTESGRRSRKVIVETLIFYLQMFIVWGGIYPRAEIAVPGRISKTTASVPCNHI